MSFVSSWVQDWLKDPAPISSLNATPQVTYATTSTVTNIATATHTPTTASHDPTPSPTPNYAPSPTLIPAATYPAWSHTHAHTYITPNTHILAHISSATPTLLLLPLLIKNHTPTPPPS